MCGPRPQRLPRPRRGQRKAAGDPSPAHRRAHRPPFSPPSPRRGRAGPPALRRSSALTGHAPVPTAGLGAAHPAGVGPNRTAALRLPPRGPAASPRILHPLLQPRRAPRPPRKDRAAPSPALRSIPPPIATWAQRSAGPYLRVPPPAECRHPQPPPRRYKGGGTAPSVWGGGSGWGRQRHRLRPGATCAERPTRGRGSRAARHVPPRAESAARRRAGGAPGPPFGPRGSAGSAVRGPWRRCFARHQPARLCAVRPRRFPHPPERFWLSPA